MEEGGSAQTGEMKLGGSRELGGSVFLSLLLCFVLPLAFFLSGGDGEKEPGPPHYDRSPPSPGQGKRYTSEKPAAAIALRAACSGISNKG